MARFIPFVLIACLVCPALAPAASAAPGVAFQKRLASESMAFGILRNNLQRSVGFARSRADLFSPETESKKELLSRDEKMVLWSTWSGVLASLAALDDIRREHNKFELFQDIGKRHASFAIADAAFLAGYRHALDFIALAEKNPALDTILNEAVPELGIPAGTFGRFKFRFLNVAVATEFAALQVIARTYGAAPPELQPAIDEDSRAIWGMGRGKGMS